MKDDKRSTLQHWGEAVDAELYEELLNRYERILVFAGQLQEKLENHKLLEQKSGALEAEVNRMRRISAVDAAYIRLLENSLRALGIEFSDDPGRPLRKS